MGWHRPRLGHFRNVLKPRFESLEGRVLLAADFGAEGGSTAVANAVAPGVLYGIDNVTDQLITIDTTTGAATEVGPLTGARDVFGIAFREDGTLFGADANSTLITIDTTTGRATNVGPLGTTGVIAGMSFNSEGALYGIEDGASLFFSGLGDLPGGQHFSLVNGLSADGTTAVGRSWSGTFEEAFRWTLAEGMVGLGDLPGGITQSRAYGVSADGSVIVGGGVTSQGSRSYRWTESTGMVEIGGTAANGVSADGSVIVGSDNREPYRWTSSGGLVGLGNLPGTNSGAAIRVSADGEVVVGTSSASGSDPVAFRWTDSTGMVGPGDLPGSFTWSSATDVSADGSVVVGSSYSAFGFEAFRWTESGGMVGLGDLAGGNFYSQAIGVSGDGSLVVGSSFTGLNSIGSNISEAFLWDADNGMRSVPELLTMGGIDLGGWKLTEAYAISADGSVIVGNGKNPDGQLEAWIAGIGNNEPPTAVQIDSNTVFEEIIGQYVGVLTAIDEDVGQQGNRIKGVIES